MHLGLRIKIARISKGITQEQLAEQINKTRPLISSIEQTGKANYYTLKRICEVLTLDIEEINNEQNESDFGLSKNRKQTEQLKQFEKEIHQLQMLTKSQADLILALKEKIELLEKGKKK
jgi:transcriptional regulator with XRE-family HTH domain